MAKEIKNSLFNIEKEEKQSKKVKKNKPKKQSRKVNKKKDTNDKFSFDSEIIIGVTKIQDEPKEKKKKTSKSKKEDDKKIKKNNKTKKVKKVNKEKINNKKENKKPLYKKQKNTYEEEIISEEELINRRENRKLKTKRKIRILKYFSIVALIVTVILLVMFSPLFNIKEILVENNEIVSSDQIISLSQICVDTNTFKLNTGKINKQVKENAYIEEIKIIRKLPSTVIINVTERKPTYLIEYANGYVCIDKKGYILDISNDKKELPILQGIETASENFVVGNRLDKNDLNKIFVLSKVTEVANDVGISNLITRIDVEKINSIKLILEAQQKTIYIGNDSNLNIKLLTVQQILSKTEGLAGEIFVDMDLNSEYPIFRERV